MPVKPVVLYVDDEPENCIMMQVWLREICGIDVKTAHDGESALRHLGQELFDGYLLDYALPDTTGVELCRRIRKSDLHVPIVMYTALDRPIDKERAFAAGADAYLVKPDEIELLGDVFKDLLSPTVPSRMVKDRRMPSKLNSISLSRSRLSQPERFRRRSSGII